MRGLCRAWPALFAWGSGLLHLALGASVAVGRSGAGAMVVMGALVLLGAAELAWGSASLRAGRPVMPRTAVAGAVGSMPLAAAALAVGCSPFATGAAVGLVLAATGFAAGRRSAAAPRSRPRASVAGIAVGAVLVAALVAPALSTTDGAALPGQLPPGGHGEHAGH